MARKLTLKNAFILLNSREVDYVIRTNELISLRYEKNKCIKTDVNATLTIDFFSKSEIINCRSGLAWPASTYT